MDDWMVTVCDACFKASCWQGIYPCDRAKTAGTVERKASELRELDRENLDFYTPAALAKHTGVPPPRVSQSCPPVGGLDPLALEQLRKDAQIGRLYRELWLLGAPWP